MSRDNVEELVSRFESGAMDTPELANTTTAADLIALGQDQGLEFSEADLGAFLRLRIANAESLPRPWGWAVARELKLVRT